MTKLKSRSPMEKSRTTIGSLLVAVSIFTLIAQAFYVGSSMFFFGIILVAVQDKVMIDFNNKIAIKYFSIFKIPMPIGRTKIDLKKYESASLQQISEKGRVQTRAQSMAYNNREYWIKVKSSKGSLLSLGYDNNYDNARNVLIEIKNNLNYTITDSIQEKLLKNKTERNKRKYKK